MLLHTKCFVKCLCVSHGSVTVSEFGQRFYVLTNSCVNYLYYLYFSHCATVIVQLFWRW